VEATGEDSTRRLQRNFRLLQGSFVFPLPIPFLPISAQPRNGVWIPPSQHDSTKSSHPIVSRSATQPSECRNFWMLASRSRQFPKPPSSIPLAYVHLRSCEHRGPCLWPPPCS
jgi:hypothetical protein